MQIDKTSIVTAGMFVTVGLVMASIFGFFHAKIDLYPHLSFVPPDPYNIDCQDTIFLNQVCSVHLTDEIVDSNKYINLKKLLDGAGSGDKITIHLAGFGGDAHTLLSLYNSLRSTKADVTMSVEGHVYSAHALLAVMGDHLVVGKHLYLMFHDVQVAPEARAIPAVAAFIDYAHGLFNDVLAGIIPAEVLAYLEEDPSHELYLPGEAVKIAFDKTHIARVK